jgi:hypothetical protein
MTLGDKPRDSKGQRSAKHKAKVPGPKGKPRIRLRLEPLFGMLHP